MSTSVLPLPSPTAPEPRRLERNAGYLVAVPAVTAVLVILALIRLPLPQEPPPLPMKVVVQLEEPPEPEPMVEPEPEPQPVEEPPPMPEVVATRPDSDEQGEEIVDPVKAEEPPATRELVLEQPLDEPVPTPPNIVDWVPNVDEAEQIAALREELNQAREQLDAKAREVREFVIKQEVSSAARDFELSSDGGTEGAIRLLNLQDHFPEAIIEQIKARYGIRYDHRYTTPSAGRGFLNAATTEAGSFSNTQRPGYYEVLVLSPKAIHAMSLLEREAMLDKGFEPRRDRVRKVVFGIVMNRQGEYDLGVTDLEIERVR